MSMVFARILWLTHPRMYLDHMFKCITSFYELSVDMFSVKLDTPYFERKAVDSSRH